MDWPKPTRPGLQPMVPPTLWCPILVCIWAVSQGKSLLECDTPPSCSEQTLIPSFCLDNAMLVLVEHLLVTWQWSKQVRCLISFHALGIGSFSQTFIKCLLCARYCSIAGNIAGNKTGLTEVGGSCVGVWGPALQAENSLCKGPGAGLCLMCWRNCQEACVAGAE